MVATVAWLLIAPGAGRAEQVGQSGGEPPLPVATLDGPVTTISEFLAYGPWTSPLRGDWYKTPAELPLADGRVLWAELEKPPFNAVPRLTGDATGGVDYAPFAAAADDWKGHHVMLLACKVIARESARVILDLSNDDNVNVYINGKHLGIVTDWVMPRGGQFHAFPAWLEKGENILLFRHVTSNRAPRFKVNVVSDHSRDFDAAWGAKEGLLSRLVYSAEEKPSMHWPVLLKDMTVQAGVADSFTGKVLQEQTLRSGDVLHLEAAASNDDIKGAYTVRYKNDSGQGEEQFVVGDPRKIKEQLENRLKRLHPDRKAKINAETLLRRLEILCEPSNYKVNDRRWQTKTAYTIGSLAALLGALERENPDPAKDAPGLHIRGFSSSLDISTQHYRLYVPSTYRRGRKLPLLIIMPTTVSASRRPFIESAFIANHRSAVRMSRVAERHGLALLWPGYRNIPDGLPGENAHLGEVLKAVQADYDLDLQRVHLHGICSGGIFAGNGAAKWPGRFASIIYNRAIFRRDWELVGDGHLRDWMQCCDPTESILRNKGISIFLTNTESAQEGHGGIELAREFIDKAAGLGKTVTADFTSPAIGDTLGDRVFQWAASCKLERPDTETSDRNSRQGYSGPVPEVFATPMIVVQGTSGSEAGNNIIEKFIRGFQQYYAECFYGAACRVVKDTELSDADTASHSLIVIGNPKTNKMWRDLQGDAALEITDAGIALGKHKWVGKLAYHLVLKNRRASSHDTRYILFVGATDMECLGDYPVESLFRSVCDFEAWRMEPAEDLQPVVGGKLRDFIAESEWKQMRH